MRLLNRKLIRAFALTAGLVIPGVALADPVAVTGGHLDAFITEGGARMVFEGDEFLLVLGADGFRTSLALNCPCSPGTSLDLGGQFSFAISGGRAVVDGVEYPHIFPDLSGAFVTPSFTVEGSAPATFSVPFSFSGTVVGFLESSFIRGGGGVPIFTKSLFGRGEATVTFNYGDPGPPAAPYFFPRLLRYEFAAAEPVPEPGTMLLCAAGAATLAARARRRRSARVRG